MKSKLLLLSSFLALISTALTAESPLVIEYVTDLDNPTLNRPYMTERVVLTGNTADLSLQAFAFRNMGEATVPYTRSHSGFSLVIDNFDSIVGTNEEPTGGVNTIRARPNFSADALPGTTVNASMRIRNQNDTETLLDFGDYVMTGIVNRPMSGSVQIDAGRFVRAASVGSTPHNVGTLTLSGGDLNDNEATRVDTTGTRYTFNQAATLLNSSAHTNASDPRRPSWAVVRSNELSSSGQGMQLVGSDPSRVEFRDENISTDYNIRFTSSGEKNVQLSGSDFNLMFDNVERSLRNAELDISNLSLEFTGTALTNRRFSVHPEDSLSTFVNDGYTTRNGYHAHQGRAMVGATESPYEGTIELRVGSNGSDDQFTRVILQEGTLNNAGVTVTHDQEHFFNGPGSTNLTLDYDVTFDSSTSGRKFHNVNLNQLMISGEDDGPLANQALQSLNAGVSKSFVEDRVVQANNVTMRALSGGAITEVSNRVFSHGGDDHFTRVSIETPENDILTPNSLWSYNITDRFDIQAVTSPSPTGQVFGGTRDLSIIPEGLPGENAQETVSYDWYTQFLNPAQVTFLHGPGSADSSNPATIEIDDRIQYTFTTGNDIAKVDPYWRQLSVQGARIIELDGFEGDTGGDVYVRAVNTDTIAMLGGTFTSRIVGTFSHNQNIIGAEYGDIGEFYWEYTLEVDRPLAPFAFLEASAGVQITGGLTNDSATFSVPTAVDILDTNPLSNDVILEIAFNPFNSAEGQDADTLISDIAVVNGLDGELFVMQMNFDPDEAVTRFGAKSAATLLWFDPDNSIWRNAVDGNSDEGSGRDRFLMSYADYLDLYDNPQLSHFGIDLDSNTVWAILDHNSSFAASAIPEPGTIILVCLMGLAFGFKPALNRFQSKKRLK